MRPQPEATLWRSIHAGRARRIGGLLALVLALSVLPQSNALAARKPDLVVGSVTSARRVTVGETLAVTDTTKNNGNKAAAASSTAIFLSKDTQKNSGDVKIGARSVPSLAPGAKSQATKNLTIGTNRKAGAYYLIACADAKKQISESNENNNCRASSEKVEIRPVVSISGPSQPVLESSSTVATFTVKLNAASTKTVKVDYEDVPGTATKPADYTGTSGTLTFNPGQTSKSPEVRIKLDDEPEVPETFKMRLSTPVNAVLSPTQNEAEATIEDNPFEPLEEIAFHRIDGPDPEALFKVPALYGFLIREEDQGIGRDPEWSGSTTAWEFLYFSSKGTGDDWDIYRRRTPTGVVTKINLGDGDKLAPAITWDDNLLAFHSDENLTGNNTDGDFEIFVRNMSNSNITQVTDNAVDDVRPDWAPGGDALVWASGDDEKDLWGTWSVGSPPQAITNTPGVDEDNPVFGPDFGYTIAFDSDEHGSRDIYFYRLQGNTFQRVTSGDGDETMPTFAPSGLELAYRNSEDGRITKFDISACTETALSSEGGQAYAPDWRQVATPMFSVPGSGCFDGPETPIEGEVAFISNYHAAAPNVFAAPVDLMTETDVVNTTGSSKVERDVAWNGDGSAVAFARGDKLYTKDAETGDVTRISDFLEGEFRGLTWHPTEDVLAFGYRGASTSGQSSSDFDIVVLDLADPSSLAVVTGFGDASNERFPDWSPDGTKLAFVSDKADGPASSLYTRTVSFDAGGTETWIGGSEQRLTHLAFNVSGPDWSPNGADIAFASPHPGATQKDTELYALAVANGTVHRLTNDAADHKDPAWSPDFTRLGWARKESFESNFDLVGRLLTESCPSADFIASLANEEAPDWRPDGSTVTVPDFRACPDVTKVSGTGP